MANLWVVMQAFAALSYRANNSSLLGGRRTLDALGASGGHAAATAQQRRPAPGLCCDRAHCALSIICNAPKQAGAGCPKHVLGTVPPERRARYADDNRNARVLVLTWSALQGLGGSNPLCASTCLAPPLCCAPGGSSTLLAERIDARAGRSASPAVLLNRRRRRWRR